MSTPAQLAANRDNAKKSTGPRTVEGKEASRFNALKHGADAESVVIPGEDPEQYAALAADYTREFEPATAREQFHVETLVRAAWQKKRLERVEARLYRALLAEGAKPDELDIALYRDSPNGKLLRKVFSQIASLERAHFRAVRELNRIRAERQKPANAVDPDDLIDAAIVQAHAELASFRDSRSATGLASWPRPEAARAEPSGVPKPPESARDADPALRL